MNPAWLMYSLPVLCVVANTSFAEPSAVPFSQLPREQQYRIRRAVAAPPTRERTGPYSTPMYYLMHEGYDYDGKMDVGPSGRTYIKDKPGPDYGYWKLDRNRPDWQEVMIRNWAELGLNNTHFNIYPENNSLELSPPWRAAIEDFVSLSEQYGLAVGVRLDALGGYEAWEMNPDNPQNLIEPYLRWVREIVTMLKGKTAYYVLGDELTLHKAQPGLDPKKWTPEKYLAYFKRVCEAIKSIEPTAKVSMFAAESGKWSNVLYLLEQGYARYGDAVAINYYNYQDVPRFFADAAKLAPNLLFLSNGVGYTSCALAQPRYPEGDGYTALPTEEAHGNTIAKNMFAWWDLGAATAPYYISLRNWVVRGKVYPRWFGFFGFEDFVIDEHDNMTVKRYPGWYAFQTVAHTFYDRDKFRKPSFPVDSSAKLSMFRAYEHGLRDGSELVLMLWNDTGPVRTRVDLGSREYLHPVRIDVFNQHRWTDVPARVEDKGVALDLEVGLDPVIVRLVRLR